MAMRLLVACMALCVVACGPAFPPPDGGVPDPEPVPADRPADRRDVERSDGTPVEDAEAMPAPEVEARSLRVDHAWVRDASTTAEQRQQRQAIEQLRAAVARGGSFEAAWEALRVAPDDWHIGEGETYPYALIPADARDLPPGSVSGVIPGDGGLHVFRILAPEASR